MLESTIKIGKVESVVVLKRTNITKGLGELKKTAMFRFTGHTQQYPEADVDKDGNKYRYGVPRYGVDVEGTFHFNKKECIKLAEKLLTIANKLPD